MTRQATGRNQRKYDRIRVVNSKQIWNLSEGGAYVASAHPKRLGSVIQFELKLGDQGPIFKSLAMVIRVLHKPNPKMGEPAGMALKFLDVKPEDQARLHQFLLDLKKPDRNPEDIFEHLQVPDID